MPEHVYKYKKKDWTEEERKLLHDATNAVWQYIGCDYLAAVADSKGKSAESITIRRSEVVEAVLDASRTDEELRRMKHPELIEKMRETSYKDLIALTKLGFAYQWYGM